MAYRICYGPDTGRGLNGAWRRIIASFAIGAVVVTGSVFSDRIKIQTNMWLVPTQMRADEIALKHLATSITVGEGWYVSAVEYCREIMEFS